MTRTTRPGAADPSSAPAPLLRSAARPRSAGGVVLAGGRSTRMGRDKAGLPWGLSTLLDHVLAVLATAVDGPLVVVGPADRPGPEPAPTVAGSGRVRRVADPWPDGGPLVGIATGLRALTELDCGTGIDRAFVASVDLPLLHPAFVAAVLDRCRDGVEVALPRLHGHRQPLAAAYAPGLGGRAAALVAAGASRPGELFAASRLLELSADDLLADPALAAADPELAAVHGANTPAELAALAARASPSPG